VTLARKLRTFIITILSVLAIALSAWAEGAPGAKALEAKLLAPCCFGGTLDIHDSEMARELRHEIEDRVAKGESTEAVENDFVARYGPRVRAMPNEKAMSNVVTGLLAMFGASGVALFVIMRRRSGKHDEETLAAADARKARDAKDGGAPKPAERDALDDRLDAELRDDDKDE
jgi:cytochrome c-type biogenesis protein CcmH